MPNLNYDIKDVPQGVPQDVAQTLAKIIVEKMKNAIKITIKSEESNMMMPLEKELETNQTLSIYEDGRVYWTRHYMHGTYFDEEVQLVKRIERRRFKIKDEEAKYILALAKAYFISDCKLCEVIDAGVWGVNLEFDDGSLINAVGDLFSDIKELSYITNVIRKVTDNYDIWAFTGEYR